MPAADVPQRMLKTVNHKAAGRHVTENEVGGRFQHPSHSEDYLTEKLAAQHLLLCRACFL